MADGTAIEWTDATWNVVNGCTVHSPGCANCYAMLLAATRLKNHPSRAGLARMHNGHAQWTGEVRFNQAVLLDPLKWRRPRRIFVCAHGDLFHEDVPDDVIDQVFAVMALAPRHQFQVLTKRASRMRDYVVGDDLPFLHGRLQRIQDAAYRIAANRRGQWNEAAGMAARQQCLDALKRISDRESAGFANVWLGVSVEDQARADERIPLLLQTPAALRWLSCEPLLGPVDLTCLTISGDSEMDCLNPRDWADEVEQWRGTSDSWEDDFEDWFGRFPDQVSGTMHPTIDWVVAGGESGRGARPMHPDWARRLRDDCAHARVPFLFKQWGAWEPAQADDDCQHVHQWVCPPDTDRFGPIDRTTDALMRLVGKKDAGRHLDGRLHDGFPA